MELDYLVLQMRRQRPDQLQVQTAPLCVVRTPRGFSCAYQQGPGRGWAGMGNISPTAGLFLTLVKHTSSCCMLVLAEQYVWVPTAALSLELTR